MNQTKKITQGAMMLAILGALILIDRMLGYFFDIMVVLIVPVIIIMYSGMNTFKDGAILSVGILIIAFLLGNLQITYMIYVPVGIVTGLSYAFGIKKNLDKRTLMFISIGTYVLGEIIATFVVYPILGFPISQMLNEYLAALEESSNILGVNYTEVFTMAGLDITKIIGVVYVVSTILVGLMEGILIHLLSVFLLKRFKIKDLGTTNIWDIKPNPILAYVSLAATSLIFVAGNVENQTLYYTMVIVSIFGAIILFYFGYIFVILYSVIVLKRNLGGLFVVLAFFVPSLLLVLVVLGFLYAAGPLRKYLESKIVIQQ